MARIIFTVKKGHQHSKNTPENRKKYKSLVSDESDLSLMTLLLSLLLLFTACGIKGHNYGPVCCKIYADMYFNFLHVPFQDKKQHEYTFTSKYIVLRLHCSTYIYTVSLFCSCMLFTCSWRTRADTYDTLCGIHLSRHLSRL